MPWAYVIVGFRGTSIAARITADASGQLVLRKANGEFSLLIWPAFHVIRDRAEAAALVHFDEKLAFWYEIQYGNALQKLGDDFGNTDAPNRAVQVLRDLLDRFAEPYRAPIRIILWTHLGNSLRSNGELEHNTASLADANSVSKSFR